MRSQTLLLSCMVAAIVSSCATTRESDVVTTGTIDPMEVFLDYEFTLRKGLDGDRATERLLGIAKRAQPTTTKSSREFHAQGISWRLRPDGWYTIKVDNSYIDLCSVKHSHCNQEFLPFLNQSMDQLCYKSSGEMRSDGWCVSKSQYRQPLFYYKATVVGRVQTNRVGFKLNLDFIAPLSPAHTLMPDWLQYAAKKGY